jgi:hypothetical protein
MHTPLISSEVISSVKLFAWKSGKGIQVLDPQCSNPVFGPSHLYY